MTNSQLEETDDGEPVSTASNVCSANMGEKKNTRPVPRLGRAALAIASVAALSVETMTEKGIYGLFANTKMGKSYNERPAPM